MEMCNGVCDTCEHARYTVAAGMRWRTCARTAQGYDIEETTGYNEDYPCGLWDKREEED